jgi:transposase
MIQPLQIAVKESVPQLRALQKKHPSRFNVLQMLILIKQQGPLSKKSLSFLTGCSDKSIHIWRSRYLKEGIDSLLTENRGGTKKAKITGDVAGKLRDRLYDPKGGFRSFIEIQQWLLNEFSIDMDYHAVNKYVKRKFGAKLKVSRKSHVQKSPADEAVFKKPVRKI